MNGKPVMHHLLVIDFDHSMTSVSVKCTAPLKSPCHVVHICECDSYVDEIVDGQPQHEYEEFPEGSEDDPNASFLATHVGDWDPDFCGFNEWAQATAHESLAGRIDNLKFTLSDDREIEWAEYLILGPHLRLRAAINELQRELIEILGLNKLANWLARTITRKGRRS